MLMPQRPALTPRSTSRSRAGFTLVEMMVVMVIIAMMAALAAPSVVNLIRDRASQKDALELLGILQDAHSRSFGRGVAVRVTYTQRAPAAGPDSINIREMEQDVDGVPGGDIPSSKCTVGTLSNVRRFWQPADNERRTEVKLTIAGTTVTDGAAPTELCFTPRGRTLLLSAGVWVPLNDAIVFEFEASATGTKRFVYLYPSGYAKIRM